VTLSPSNVSDIPGPFAAYAGEVSGSPGKTSGFSRRAEESGHEAGHDSRCTASAASAEVMQEV
jgi:hypothetical protein